MPVVSALCTQIGRTVARRREYLDMTQDGLARLLRATGLSWTAVTVAKVESGQREIKAGELVALGLALGLSPEQMLSTEGPTTLARGDTWVPGDAITTWARGETPTVHQRAQWALDETPGAAPLRMLDDRARAMASFLSHLPPGTRPQRVSLVDMERQRAEVAAQVEQWVRAREDEGSAVSPAGRRAKERHVWAAVRAQHDPPPPVAD